MSKPRARSLGLVVLTAVLSALGSVAVPASAGAAPPTPHISRIAGDVGSGPAGVVGQQPGDVAVHGNDIWIVDSLWHVVRRVVRVTGLETAVLGPGVDHAPGEIGSVTTDALGRLYFTRGQQIFRRDLDGSIHHVAGSGSRGNYTAEFEGRPATTVPMNGLAS